MILRTLVWRKPVNWKAHLRRTSANRQLARHPARARAEHRAPRARHQDENGSGEVLDARKGCGAFAPAGARLTRSPEESRQAAAQSGILPARTFCNVDEPNSSQA